LRLPVYLDNHATTQIDPRVLEAMLPYLRDDFGNASSSDHAFGAKASGAVEAAREKVASTIVSSPEEIIFTSGATESDNLAILGAAGANTSKGNHYITSAIEHKAVLDTFKKLETTGSRVTYLQVSREGTVSPRELEEAMTPATVLVSIMFANNEIGTIQQMAELSRVAHAGGALFHSDAAQAVGHIPVAVDQIGVDMMSFSAHKSHGPKGVGGLFVRRRGNRVRLTPLLMGGGQERGLRSGTLNVPGIVGMGEAFALAVKELKRETKRESELRDRLQEGLLQAGNVDVNGCQNSRLPHNLNVRISGVDGKALISAASKSVAFSASSACSSQVVEPSHVLLAIGYSPEDAHRCVRFGLGRFTTSEEIEFAIQEIVRSVRRLRTLN
jgi:cysteine desulfurase